jgi:hypothetical protein
MKRWESYFDSNKRKNPEEDFKIVEKLGKGGFGSVYLV